MKTYQPNSLQSTEIKNLFLSRFENKIESYTGQFIPDCIKFSEQLKSKAAQSTIQSNACLSLDINTYEGFTLNNKKTKRKKEQLVEDIKLCRQEILAIAQKILEREIINNDEFTIKRIEIIIKVIDIFLSKSHQISQQAIAYFLKYAIAATDPQNQEQFYFSISLGGDTVAPTMVEAYLIYPLNLLRELWQLLQQDRIYRLPRLVLVFTYVCQLAENDRDKGGNLISPALHIYNSRQTLLRIAEFINFTYPNLASYCDYLIFPAYDRRSMTRLFCAVSWQKFPGDKNILQKMFRIAGDVQDKNLAKNDLLKQVLGDFNAYVPRHSFRQLIPPLLDSLRVL